jgi:protein TonB
LAELAARKTQRNGPVSLPGLSVFLKLGGRVGLTPGRRAHEPLPLSGYSVVARVCAFQAGADVIVIEFVVFVVSSGLFYSGRFRHHLWAVVIAGAIATGSSILFFYDLYEKLEAHPEAPVRVVKQVVQVPVIRHVSQPPALSRPENCRDDYPFFGRIFGREGTTELAFTVSADGTVRDVKIARSSGSDGLDDAAVKCVAKWHYRPALKDGELVDAPMTVKVAWNLDEPDSNKGADTDKK